MTWSAAEIVHRAAAAWDNFPSMVRAPVHVMVRTAQLYMDDSCSTYAAAIAYYALFSMVPLALVILSIFGLVVSQDRIVNFVFNQLPLKDTAAIQSDVRAIVARAHEISVAGLSFGLLVLLWSSSGIFAAIRKGLNATRRRRRSRPFWRQKLVDFILVPSLGLLIIISIALTAAAQIAIAHVGKFGPFNLSGNIGLQVTSYLLPLPFSFVTFLLLYRYVPSSRPIWMEAISGAALASVLFELVKNLYALIFSFTSFSKDTAIYAGFGTALGVLLWLFLNASILLLGLEFGRAVKLARRGLVIEPEQDGQRTAARDKANARPKSLV